MNLPREPVEALRIAIESNDLSTARAALRDDLYSLHRHLTAEVLRRPDRSVDAWIDDNPATERCLQTLAEIRVGHVFDTTTLPVAVREVRNLLLAGSLS